ncbi:MAG: hypothetical protein JXJ19_06280 [Elusimicrobia bacterium]|nr:hypothetical protein [Elusimicrobiota bacterium]
MTKAIILISGGLDSILAAYILRDQGLGLVALHFTSPFFVKRPGKDNRSLAEKVSEKLGIPFRTIFMGQDYLDMIAFPAHGYGRNMNPCIDCRIHQFRLAGKVMEEEGASFIATGEVLGQRPMSQTFKSLKLIDGESGMEGLVLRPLSAGALEATVPEREGLVDRERLKGFTGRSRKGQMELCARYGITPQDYSTPAGGCRLTNQEYAEKVKDLIRHSGKLILRETLYLNLGRHFRVSDTFKVVVGRNENENAALERMVSEGEVKMWPRDVKGPVCVGIGDITDDNIRFMAGVCGRYSDTGGAGEILLGYIHKGETHNISSAPFDDKGILKYKIC